MKLIKKTLACGAVIQQLDWNYKDILKLTVVQEGSSFARVFKPGQEDFGKFPSFYYGGLELHISRKNLRQLRSVIDCLIKQKP